MHVSRSEGPSREGPSFHPGFSVASLSKLPGIDQGDRQRLFAELDSALFQNLTQKDVSKLLDLLNGAPSELPSSPLPAGGEYSSPEHVGSIEQHRGTISGKVSEQAVAQVMDAFAARESVAEVHVARLQAQTRLAEADQVFSGPHHMRLPDWDAAPETLLQVSHDLFNQGGYLNYLRSAEVSRVLLVQGTTAVPALNGARSPFARRCTGRWLDRVLPQQQWGKRVGLALLTCLLTAFVLYVLLR